MCPGTVLTMLKLSAGYQSGYQGDGEIAILFVRLLAILHVRDSTSVSYTKIFVIIGERSLGRQDQF